MTAFESLSLMKQLIAMAIVGFSVFHVQSMEVWGEVKGSEKSFLINAERQKAYGYDNLPKPWIASIKLLPHELKEHTQSFFLAAYLNEFGDEKKKELLSKHHPVLLINLIVRAERLCPLYLGNKKFGWKDVVVLKKKEQEDLSKICNQDPYDSLCVGTNNKLFCNYGCSKYCASIREKTYLEILQSMPENIKKDLIVNQVDGRTCSVCCLMTVPLPSLISSVICYVNGVSLCNATGFIIAGTGTILAYTAQRVSQNFCSKKYYVDRDEVENRYN
jgi:hypothetical protein